ncbi:MAG: prolipoprotein diacylglyceryl transferase [Anaerolineae bacterium]|nr:prolipoprotein diacylglyceryl transferase [Anaerolineae bacterium]
MSIDAYGIHLGPLYIRFYALILISGMVVGAYLAARRAPKFGLDPKYIWDGLTWAIIPGLIGARIYHILTPSPASGLTTQYYLANPLQMLAIWNGGLGIYGAIIGGIVGIWLYARRQKQPLLRWLDLVAPSMAIGQAIGRWGNFVNQELYGAPSDLPWAIYIRPENRLPDYTAFERFHPLFLYESLWMLGTALVLIGLAWRWRERARHGTITLLYIISYATIRFLLDFLRLDSHGIQGIPALTTAQIVSLIAASISTALLVRWYRLDVKAREVAHERQGR